MLNSSTFFGCLSAVKLNGNRTVTGVLRGFDQFMNLVLDETFEEVRAASDISCTASTALRC